MLPAVIAAAALAFAISYGALGFLIPRLIANGIYGNDVNKPEKPQIAEMGGLGVAAGLIPAALFFALLGVAFPGVSVSWIALASILAAACAIALIGAIDDLVSIPQLPKALIPMLASIPLIMLMAGGSMSMHIPVLGDFGFGILYFAIIALSIAVSSNLTNMLAGFNGMEYGMALPMYAGLSVVALLSGNYTVALVAAAALGAFAAGFAFGFPKAKAFPGDVGTFLIGGLLACLLIAGRMEMYAIVFIPYMMDFAIKAWNKFPSSNWWGEYRDGKLYCKDSPRGFAQLLMKMFNGIEEQKLVLFFIALEAVFSAAGVLLFVLKL